MLKVGDYVFSRTAKNDFWPGRVTLLEATTGKVCVKFIDRPRTKTKWVSSNDVVVYDPLVKGLDFSNPKMRKALDLVKKTIEEQSLSTPCFRVVLKHVDLDALDDDIAVSDEIREMLQTTEDEERCEELMANVVADNKAFLDAIDSDDEDKPSGKAPAPIVVCKKQRRVDNSLYNLIAKAKKQPVAPIPSLVNLQDRSLSDYEKIQAANREKRQNMLLQAAKQWQETTSLMGLKSNLEGKKKKQQPRKSLPALPTRVLPARSTRQRHTSTGSSIPSSVDGFTPRKRCLFDDDLLNDNDLVAAKKSRKRIATWSGTANVLSVESITEEMLENVCDFVSEKIYNGERGTSCHQCRQKTLDMKTVCRSGRCHGVRGAFCGVCLRNRYAQDARECLLDPNWECPPCRGVCNCSICRNRMGKRATGIMTKIALENGFQSVHHLLVGSK